MAITESEVREGTTVEFGSQSMTAPLRRVLVHTPGPEYNVDQWNAWGFEGSPDLDLAVSEHKAFVEILLARGIDVDYLDEHTSVHTTATYDPALITDEGAVMLRSGRVERQVEALPMARKLVALGIPIIGWLRGGATMDGGDTLWLDESTLLVARGYRTNDEGFDQLRRILSDSVSDIRQVELPHWLGPQMVMHLMSVVSLVADDLAVVYPRAAPIRLLDALREREYRVVEVPDEEFDTQGSNVLALAPNVAVICAGNPQTAALLREEGAEVIEYAGSEISVRRISGPTCNTRPLLRR